MKDISVIIHPVFGNQKIDLENTKYITQKSDTVTITTFKFYISNVVLEYQDGSSYIEKNSNHLINTEEENTLHFILKNIENKPIKKITFNIGIDEKTNTSGDLDGDLDPSLGMYWAWNSGYINMKLEGKSNSCATSKKEFLFHIGGYLPKQNALQKVSLLVNNNTNAIIIKTDVSKWLNEINLKDTKSIMIPSAKAIEMAQLYKNMFSTDEEK